jgi:hypothetical protein
MAVACGRVKWVIGNFMLKAKWELMRVKKRARRVVDEDYWWCAFTHGISISDFFSDTFRYGYFFGYGYPTFFWISIPDILSDMDIRHLLDIDTRHTFRYGYLTFYWILIPDILSDMDI